ncbi:hypothetical protein DNTS_015921 [Danionella cerebrum]|uniref:Protein kinase C-binding protein 1 n=1 Tax=Danionella cerebrum TaxID=2873325 RepID=A0A553NM82_9TELE|nr:hypothetical protein DNTS_015921 [Danionella translucida]
MPEYECFLGNGSRISPPCIAAMYRSREREAERDCVAHSPSHPITCLRVALKPIGNTQLRLVGREGKESYATEGMEISTRSKDPVFLSPPLQSELRHGPFYYVKQPALTSDPVDVVPQDGRNDFYCWVCHREGQVLCCELCPRVYHAKCLRLAAEPEGDWFCPECEKITVAECIETQSKAMTMLTLEQLSFLLKFALQKMKQPGTEQFQKPVPLEHHPDYAEYIFHPMDLCTLEKNIKKKIYGSTEAFLADVKWILHNCIIYNGGNHKLTATAKVIVKICEHEMNEIEVCPECYLSACQKRENWFCEPCSNPHPLVWAKLKGFPFWPAKALRDKEGQVDARFFGQHDSLIKKWALDGNEVNHGRTRVVNWSQSQAVNRGIELQAWVPMNNCYLMSKEIPFSVKKTKGIFNSAMQEMEVHVENIRKKHRVFNYAPFRTPYTPENQFQMLLDPTNPLAVAVKTEKIKFNFDVTASPKLLMGMSFVSCAMTRSQDSVIEMPRSPMSNNSSVHTGSDGEQEEKGHTKAPKLSCSTREESQDCTASPAPPRAGSPQSFHSPTSSTPVKHEKNQTIGGILNLNLDRSKAEMNLKELSESVQQHHQVSQSSLTSKRQTRSSFQLNLNKTIENCKAHLGIDEIEDVCKEEQSESEDSEKSDSANSEYGSNNAQISMSEQNIKNSNEGKTENEQFKKKIKSSAAPGEVEENTTEPTALVSAATKVENKQKNITSESDVIAKDTPGAADKLKKASPCQDPGEKSKASEGAGHPVNVDQDSDSERELVIDLGEELGGKRRRMKRKDSAAVTVTKMTSKSEVKLTALSGTVTQPITSAVASSSPSMKETSQLPSTTSVPASSITCASSNPSSSSLVSSSTVKKQRPLLPRETIPVVKQALVWNASTGFQTSQKWHMQKVPRQQQGQTQPQQQGQMSSSSAGQQSSASSRYQTRQSIKGEQRESLHTTSTSALTLVSSAAVSTTTTPGDFQIPPTSADVATDIAKYTNKIMDTITGTMTEIYNDLSKNTSGNTIAEIRRLRIETEKLQWLHQQELSEMKHNLELTMAEMRQSLEQERERIVSEVKKQMEVEKQQVMDETKKKQWCANCRKEAIFYCCWNTSYCDYPCQQAHWPEHMKSCTQSATPSQPEQESIGGMDAALKSPGQPNMPSGSPRETEPNSAAEKDYKADTGKGNVTVTVS